MAQPRPDDVLRFWFGTPATTPEELGVKMRRWFRGGPDLDREIAQRFQSAVDEAIHGGLNEWLEVPKGWLALLIVLDQFTRNVFREDARTYAGDARAQEL